MCRPRTQHHERRINVMENHTIGRGGVAKNPVEARFWLAKDRKSGDFHGDEQERRAFV